MKKLLYGLLIVDFLQSLIINCSKRFKTSTYFYTYPISAYAAS